MNGAYLLLGGNIGERARYLSEAVMEIEKRIGTIIKKSSLYETEQWPAPSSKVEEKMPENEKQNNYLNQAILVETMMAPKDLLKNLLEIEKNMGRIRNGEMWAERIIDIDILFFFKNEGKNTSIILEEENLKIPHPYIHLRRFTLEPLKEIAADLIHPVFNRTISELLKECGDKLQVHKIISM